MNEARGGPTIQFFNRLAEILQDLLTDEFVLAFRREGNNKAGDAIDYPAKILFARAHGFLSTLPVVNIRLQGIPADDASFRISPGESAYVEPAIYAIGTTDTVLRVIRTLGFDRASPRGQHARKVIGMNDVGGGPTLQFVKRPAK